MLFIPMNFFVHTFMYSYYALMTMGVRVPRWCAMCITSMQTVQMLCGVALTALVLKLKIVDHIEWGKLI
jgi:elongation of very long chain fatty acids protein 6